MGSPRSPRKPSGFSDELIDEALAVFQPRTTRPLSREDGRQIVHNLSGFFRVLLTWKRAQASMLAVPAPVGESDSSEQGRMKDALQQRERQP